MIPENRYGNSPAFTNSNLGRWLRNFVVYRYSIRKLTEILFSVLYRYLNKFRHALVHARALKAQTRKIKKQKDDVPKLTNSTSKGKNKNYFSWLRIEQETCRGTGMIMMHLWYQCCGSGMFYPGSGSLTFFYPGSGSRIRGVKKHRIPDSTAHKNRAEK
jgi:hypothetical protein